MIKMIVDRVDGTHIECSGTRLDLLAEIPLGVGKILRQVTAGAPLGLRDELIKGVFECILMEVHRVEGETDANQ